jgi:hypothetical protein
MSSGSFRWCPIGFWSSYCLGHYEVMDLMVIEVGHFSLYHCSLVFRLHIMCLVCKSIGSDSEH